MRTGGVAKTFVVSPSLIRLLDRQGLLGAIPRDRAGHRRFGPSDLERVRRVIYPQSTERETESPPVNDMTRMASR